MAKLTIAHDSNASSARLSRLVSDACKYLFVGNAMERWRGCKERRRRGGGYTLNCSAEIDGVSPLPFERSVCPTCATRAHVCVYVRTCVCMAHVYVQRRQGKHRKSDVSGWLKMMMAQFLNCSPGLYKFSINFFQWSKNITFYQYDFLL